MSASPHSVSSPLTRTRSLRRAVAARLDRLGDQLRAPAASPPGPPRPRGRGSARRPAASAPSPAPADASRACRGPNGRDDRPAAWRPEALLHCNRTYRRRAAETQAPIRRRGGHERVARRPRAANASLSLRSTFAPRFAGRPTPRASKGAGPCRISPFSPASRSRSASSPRRPPPMPRNPRPAPSARAWCRSSRRIRRDAAEPRPAARRRRRRGLRLRGDGNLDDPDDPSRRQHLPSRRRPALGGRAPPPRTSPAAPPDALPARPLPCAVAEGLAKSRFSHRSGRGGHGKSEDRADRRRQDRRHARPSRRAEGAGRHRPVRRRRGRAPGQGARPRPVRPGRRLRRQAQGHQRLCRHRRRRRLHRHRRRRPQAGHEPRRPARHQPQGDEGGRRGHQGARPGRLRHLHHQPARRDGLGAARILRPAAPHGRRHGRRARQRAASATSSPRSSASRSRTSPPSCSAAMATRWCRWSSIRPSPASRSPTSSRWAGRRRRGSTRSSSAPAAAAARSSPCSRPARPITPRATSAIEMAEAYLKDKKRLLPCAAHLETASTASTTSMSASRVIGAGGVEQIVEIELNRDEKAIFDKSVEAVRGLLDGLQGDRQPASPDRRGHRAGRERGRRWAVALEMHASQEEIAHAPPASRPCAGASGRRPRPGPGRSREDRQGGDGRRRRHRARHPRP